MNHPPPLYLPHVVAHCHQCARLTGTKVLFMHAGYGNACTTCGSLRKRKPYLSKNELNTLKPGAAKGAQYDRSN